LFDGLLEVFAALLGVNEVHGNARAKRPPVSKGALRNPGRDADSAFLRQLFLYRVAVGDVYKSEMAPADARRIVGTGPC
jgi:hypothetical protein